MNSTIFICMSYQDRCAADEVMRLLELAGRATWVEWRDLPTGSDWEGAMSRALAESGALVLILTSSSADSPHVETTCKAAYQIGLPIVTLCFDADAEPSTMLKALIEPEFWFDCFDGVSEATASVFLSLVGKLSPVDQTTTPKNRGISSSANDPFPTPGPSANRPGMFCVQCGADNPDFLPSCRVCSASMLLDLRGEDTYMACGVCSSINRVFGNFCRVCGSSFCDALSGRPFPSNAGQESIVPLSSHDAPLVMAGGSSVGWRAGQWLLTRLLGSGGQGSVFEAIHVYLRTSGALKILHAPTTRNSAFAPRMEDSIRRGLRGLAQLNTPYVARIIDFGEADFVMGRRQYLLTELVQGACLRDILPELATPNAIQLSRALRLFRQLCLGVQAAHEVRYFDDAGFEVIGVRHGDIKPANVMVTRNGDVKLIDFLLFNIPSPSNEQTAGHPPTLAYGTPGYMAPEQLARGEVTIGTDIYALGATLLQMLTLALPRDISNVEDEAALYDAVQQLNPAATVCVPAIYRSLASDPARRFSSVRKLLASLPPT